MVKRQVLIKKNVQHNAATATTNHTDLKTQASQFGCGGVVNVTCKHPLSGHPLLQDVLICLTVNQKEH